MEGDAATATTTIRDKKTQIPPNLRLYLHAEQGSQLSSGLLIKLLGVRGQAELLIDAICPQNDSALKVEKSI